MAPSASADVWRRLDSALLGIRRISSAPAGHPAIEHDGGRVEVSTLLVVDAVSRRPDCSVADVARALSVTQSTSSRLVDRAAAAGMVARQRAEADGRRVVLRLTADGRRLQEAGVRFRAARLAELLAAWSDEDVVQLARLLTELAEAVHRLDHHSGRTT